MITELKNAMYAYNKAHEMGILVEELGFDWDECDLMRWYLKNVYGYEE